MKNIFQVPSIKKIGLPKALLQYHKFKILFEMFFKELKIDYVYSDDTNKKIMDDSLKMANDEICIPCKLVYGHSLNLKNKCDKILIARIISLKLKTITCPRLTLLPELVSDLTETKVIKMNVNFKKYPLVGSFFSLGIRLGKSPLETIFAYNKALSVYKKHIKKIQEKRDRLFKEKNKLKIAVLGHPYIIYDKFLNLNIFKKLGKVNIFTPEMAGQAEDLPNIYWSEELEIVNSAYYFMGKVHGIILLTSFLCGTESLMAEFIHTKAKQCKAPIIQLIIDENMSEIMLETRVQAFLNMLSRKNA